ncbi:dihydrofolate reductase [Bacillus atrophaeus]|uniref:dihydrofolate reductase n=1 Tax=Bacillus atrophaeus TaxID=1452 RepID=UPI000D024033|nr:hypothetical protein C6W23_18905 [Bacillus atrophaeus]
MPYADSIYLTIVHTEADKADSYFPRLSDEWHVTNKVNKSSDVNNNYDLSYITYEKKLNPL